MGASQARKRARQRAAQIRARLEKTPFVRREDLSAEDRDYVDSIALRLRETLRVLIAEGPWLVEVSDRLVPAMLPTASKQDLKRLTDEERVALLWQLVRYEEEG